MDRMSSALNVASELCGAMSSCCYAHEAVDPASADALTPCFGAFPDGRLSVPIRTVPALGQSLRQVSSFYDSTIERWATQPLERLSLGQLLRFGREAQADPDRILKSARYVQRELPLRLARRLLDLQLLPYIVVTNPNIKAVYDGYRSSFDALRSFPPVRTRDDNAAFCSLLREQLDLHATLLDGLAKGLRECKNKQLVGPCLQLDAFFDSMLRSRISRRVLVEQHLHLGAKRPGYVGVICTDLSLREAAEFAALKTRQVCTETYGVAPEVVVSGDGQAAIPHIPAHVDYMLYELLKNAARAVVERHHHNFQGAQNMGDKNNGGRPVLALPSINVRVCDGGDDITVRVSDQGGGIAPRVLPHIWSYGFSTVGMDERQLQGWLGQDRTAASTSSAERRGGGGRCGEHGQPQVPLVPFGGEGDYSHLPRHQPWWYGAEDTQAEPAAGALPETDEGGVRGDAISGSLSARPLTPPGAEALEDGQQGDVCASDFLISGGMYTGVGDFDSRHKMAGLGFGLPLARLYARYFGGDLSLKVLPGFGTDAFLTLKRLEQGLGEPEAGGNV